MVTYDKNYTGFGEELTELTMGIPHVKLTEMFLVRQVYKRKIFIYVDLITFLLLLNYCILQYFIYFLNVYLST